MAKEFESLLGEKVEVRKTHYGQSRIAVPSLDGKKFVFTGGMRILSRPEAKKLVEGAGGRAVSSVSASTDFVVAGENAGSKMAKAQELGLEILTEEDFIDLLAELGIEALGGAGEKG